MCMYIYIYNLYILINLKNSRNPMNILLSHNVTEKKKGTWPFPLCPITTFYPLLNLHIFPTRFQTKETASTQSTHLTPLLYLCVCSTIFLTQFTCFSLCHLAQVKTFSIIPSETLRNLVSVITFPSA